MDCKIRRSEEKEAFKKLKLNRVPKNAVKNYRELQYIWQRGNLKSYTLSYKKSASLSIMVIDGSLRYPFLMTKPSGLYTKWEFSEDNSSEKKASISKEWSRATFYDL